MITTSYEVESAPTGIFAQIKDGLTSGNTVSVMEVCALTEVLDGVDMVRTEVVPGIYTHQILSGHPEMESIAELLGVTEMIIFLCVDMTVQRIYMILPDDRVITQDEVTGGAVNEANS